ncbi:MAG: S-adenosylmethionine:tRNA ribosyltransferase-isomerase, partial [Chitinophagaceae bacterium]
MMGSNMQDFFYDLPASRIAMTPCEPRDQSRLLVYSKGAITHTRYSCLADHLHSPARLVFNNTRVIPARMHFERESGVTI